MIEVFYDFSFIFLFITIIEPKLKARAMYCQELKVPVYAAAIARKLATVHTLDVPINKEPTWLWDTFSQWLDSIRRVDQKRPIHKLERELMSFDFESEIQWLKPFLLSCHSPTVFCHNDLQEGNILLPENTSIKNFDDTIVCIDFEWCAYNYRGFDLGNHFDERMYDYSNPDWPHFYYYADQYPSEHEKRLFVREYMKNSKNLPKDKATEDQLIKEADYFVLAAHLLWTLWSVNIAPTSKIAFGYLDYGKVRLNSYLSHKRWLLRKYMGSEATATA